MFRCPDCKSENVEVWIEVPFSIQKDGTAVPGKYYQPSFDSKDEMECSDCHYGATALEFDIHEQGE